MSSHKFQPGQKARLISVCPACDGALEVSELSCPCCGISIKGKFHRLPFSGLDSEEAWFVEQFVLTSGSLKEMARLTGSSYPTVRAKLDQIIKKMRKNIQPTEIT